ncbi:MAG: hypothetical protein R2698_10695 [Microthrixaceae bacterium]
MRQARLVVARASIGGQVLGLADGSLQVAERAPSGHERTVSGTPSVHLDWELVLRSVDGDLPARGVHQVVMTVVTGHRLDGGLVLEEMAGEAAVVRTIDRSIVLRGDGALEGFHLGLLS